MWEILHEGLYRNSWPGASELGWIPFIAPESVGQPVNREETLIWRSQSQVATKGHGHIQCFATPPWTRNGFSWEPWYVELFTSVEYAGRCQTRVNTFRLFLPSHLSAPFQVRWLVMHRLYVSGQSLHIGHLDFSQWTLNQLSKVGMVCYFNGHWWALMFAKVLWLLSRTDALSAYGLLRLPSLPFPLCQDKW